MEEKGVGEKKVNFKLRDWVFSRQRYWGEPIPLVYCEKCGYVPLPEDRASIDCCRKLITMNRLMTGSLRFGQNDRLGQHHLSANAEDLQNGKPIPCLSGLDPPGISCGISDPHNKEAIAPDTKLLDYWLPVDWYNGGMEHTTLHLLYSRFLV